MSTAKELLEQATPLPWDNDSGTGRLRRPKGLMMSGDWDSDLAAADAALIVYAVNRLPDYEAAVDALAFLITDFHADPDKWVATIEAGRAALRRLRGES